MHPANLPTGTVTFLFTDIEGSTRLWDTVPEAMRVALARHDDLMREAIVANEGVVFKTIGDAFCAAFPTAPQALAAALRAQQSLQSETWPEDLRLQVRMALHTGTTDERDGDYFGAPLNRVARLLGIGHGAQTLLSLATYELTRDELPPDCGLQDMGAHALRDLARPEQVYQLLHPSLPEAFPPLKSLGSFPNNLPQQLSSLIGRERETAEVGALLKEFRLVTLVGTGGTGKTRLSLQVAANLLELYPDGAWFVEQAPLTDPGLVVWALADVLGIREAAGTPILRTLTEWLKPRRLLIVLDNCEHLVAACATLAADLLRNCPDVRILASSREGLNVTGERLYRVPSLSSPDPKRVQTVESLSQYEAVRLFLERARGVQPAFQVTEANAPALAQICFQLDGIPLAIELAAARVRSLSPEEIHARLDNRFRLLTGGSRNYLPRQQTLRALIDWSYDLLSEQEKALIRRLSVFSGGWTLEAAEGVCTDDETPIEDWEVLDLLTGFVDKSLVVYESQPDGTGRYGLLQTIRQYARDRLTESGEADRLEAAHGDWYMYLAEETRPKLSSPEQKAALERFELEHENLRAALEGSLSNGGEVTVALRLCGAVQEFWWMRGHLAEGRIWHERAIERTDRADRTTERGRTLSGAGVLAYRQGDYAAARRYHEESLTFFREIRDQSGIAHSLNNLGNVLFMQGGYAEARGYSEESQTIFREIGDRKGLANSLNILGNVAYLEGDYAEAEKFYQESLDARKEIGDRSGIGMTFNNLGNVTYMQGDYAAARRFHEEGLAIRREIGDTSGVANSLINLGSVTQDQGDHAAARAYLEESLTILREIGDRSGVAYSLNNLGGVAINQSDPDAARVYLEESLALFREIGDRRGIAYALHGLAGAAHDQGDVAAAGCHYRESLALRFEIGDRNGAANSLEKFALLAFHENERERAATLWGAAAALREAIDAPLPQVEHDSYDRAVDETRREMGETAFAVAWEKGRALTLEDAVAFALSA